VASVAGNLIGETLTFVTIQVSGNTYESATQSVKPKQQSVIFQSDFNCPIAQEAFTIKTPPMEGTRRSSSATIPVVVTLHRKGVIDSEPIASGQVLLPVDMTAMDNLSVGLFPIEDERTEIAIAKVSVELKLSKEDEGIFRDVIKEIEKLMVSYVVSRKNSAALNVADTLQRFTSTVSPLRRFVESVSDLASWKSSYTRSWLFLITVMLYYPIGMNIAFLTLLASAFGTPLPGLKFISHRIHASAETAQDSVEQNVLFLTRSMDRLSHLSDIASSFHLYHYILIILLLWYVPFSLIVCIAMLCNSFAVQGIIVFLNRKMQPSPIKIQPETPTSILIVENQRWWLGKWSNKLIGSEAYPWADLNGMPRSKEAVLPPQGFEWTEDAQWTPDLSRGGDSEGWFYGRDFKTEPSNPQRDLSHFVRCRRWSRPISIKPQKNPS